MVPLTLLAVSLSFSVAASSPSAPPTASNMSARVAVGGGRDATDYLHREWYLAGAVWPSEGNGRLHRSASDFAMAGVSRKTKSCCDPDLAWDFITSANTHQVAAPAVVDARNRILFATISTAALYAVVRKLDAIRTD